MGEFLRLFLDSITYLWPLEIVHEWERGVYYIFGRAKWDIGPGLYPKIPFFTSISTISIALASSTTTPQTITTLAGSTITYSLAHELEVIDVMKANNRVSDHEAKAHVDVIAAVAETLSSVRDARLQPDRRKALIKTCVAEVNDRLATYGMRCNTLEFLVFVHNMKNYRLWGSQST